MSGSYATTFNGQPASAIFSSQIPPARGSRLRPSKTMRTAHPSRTQHYCSAVHRTDLPISDVDEEEGWDEEEGGGGGETEVLGHRRQRSTKARQSKDAREHKVTTTALSQKASEVYVELRMRLSSNLRGTTRGAIMRMRRG